MYRPDDDKASGLKSTTGGLTLESNYPEMEMLEGNRNVEQGFRRVMQTDT